MSGNNTIPAQVDGYSLDYSTEEKNRFTAIATAAMQACIASGANLSAEKAAYSAVRYADALVKAVDRHFNTPRQ